MSDEHNEAAELLGPLVREHRTRKTCLWTHLITGGVFSLFGLGVAGKGIFAFAKEPTRENAVLWSLLSVPFLLSGGFVVISALLRLPLRVALHQGGLYYRGRRGEWAVPWPTIDGVYQKVLRVDQVGIGVAVRDVYTIALQDGTMLEVDHHFADVDAFGDALVHQVTHMLLPGHQEAFRAGQTLRFGDVGIDKGGIHADGKSLPWGEVESLSCKQGILATDKSFLQIKRVGGLLAWAKVPVEKVKNYDVLMRIASEMTRIV